MEVNTANNVQPLQSGSLPTNLIERYKFESAQCAVAEQSKKESDKIVLNRDFIADFKLNADKLAFGTVVEGYVNGNPAALKVVSNKSENEQWCEGALNGKYFLLHSKDKQYKGKYGEKEFKLSVDCNELTGVSKFYNESIMGRNHIPDYFTVRGTIGDKEVNITLPNTKIPTDKETTDILTMLLEDNGLKAQTVNGEVKALKFSTSALKEIKKRSDKRGKVVNNDLKPVLMQGISTASGMIVGSVVSALLFKFGLKNH